VLKDALSGLPWPHLLFTSNGADAEGVRAVFAAELRSVLAVTAAS
jgi:hypothetical protein